MIVKREQYVLPVKEGHNPSGIFIGAPWYNIGMGSAGPDITLQKVLLLKTGDSVSSILTGEKTTGEASTIAAEEETGAGTTWIAESEDSSSSSSE
uniref:Uncharacterized protein n=1 Tax=Ditylenchus dipsaci TaxID=166011 RepID=A0A915D5I4_9BILA